MAAPAAVEAADDSGVGALSVVIFIASLAAAGITAATYLGY